MKKYVFCFIVGFFIGLVVFFGSIVTGNLGILGAEFMSKILPAVPKSLNSLPGLYLFGAIYSLAIAFASMIIYKVILVIRKRQTTPSFLFFSFLFFSLGIYIPFLLFVWVALTAFSNGPG